MTDDPFELPPHLDRANNGRERAYWLAHDAAPGKQNPHQFALARYTKFIKRAQEQIAAGDPSHVHLPLPGSKSALKQRTRPLSMKESRAAIKRAKRERSRKAKERRSAAKRKQPERKIALAPVRGLRPWSDNT